MCTLIKISEIKPQRAAKFKHNFFTSFNATLEVGDAKNEGYVAKEFGKSSFCINSFKKKLISRWRPFSNKYYKFLTTNEIFLKLLLQFFLFYVIKIRKFWHCTEQKKKNFNAGSLDVGIR